jgi:hypothetical protein
MASLRLAALLLAIAGAASAAGMGMVRVPAIPAKFVGGDYSAAWRAWEQPLTGAFYEARGQRLALSPEIEAFAPVLSAAKKDGAVAPFAPRSAALRLLTAQLAEEGIQPAAFTAMPAAERVARMQGAYEKLRAELQTVGEALAQAGAEAEKAGDRAALHEVQSRLTLLTASHSDYLDPKALATLRTARDQAYRAFTKLTDTVVDGAAKSAEDALRGGAGPKKTGFSAIDDLAEAAKPEDADARARRQLLAPLQDGKIPDGFVSDFARYQQMGDNQLSFDALAAFQKAAGNPFAHGPDAAAAVQGIALIAREAPAQRARDLAVQSLVSHHYLAPDMETLRVFTLRDLAQNADKENAARILKGLEAAAGPKREGPAGEALAAAEQAWKSNFGVPTPASAKKSGENASKFLKKGGTGLLTGLIPVGMAYMGWFPTAMPTWLPWLAFMNPVMPFLPYMGLAMALLYLGLGWWFKARARRR